MGFNPGNALSAIHDVHTRNVIKALGLEFDKLEKSLSTIIRNNQQVVNYATNTVTLTAGSGLTGGGDLTTDRTFAVGAGFGISVAADSVAVDQGMVPTWTGVHTFSTQDVHNAGVSLGTSGRINSAVTTAVSAIGIYLKPTNTFTPTGGDRWVYRLDDASGNTHMATYEGGLVEFGGNASGTVDAVVAIGSPTSKNAGIFFAPIYFTGAGQTFLGTASVVGGGYFKSILATSGTATAVIGGLFETNTLASQSANINDIWSCWMRPVGSTPGASNSGRTWARTGGWRVIGLGSVPKNSGTFTNLYGGYVESLVSGTVSGTGAGLTNAYGLYIEEQTKAATINNGIFLAVAGSTYKALAFRDQNAYISSDAASHLDLYGATSIDMNNDMDISTKNIITDTSTGTKIGTGTTQKVGFWNATPIVQPTTGVAGATRTGGGGTTLTDTDTFDGYTVAQVVKALRNEGLLA